MSKKRKKYVEGAVYKRSKTMHKLKAFSNDMKNKKVDTHNLCHALSEDSDKELIKIKTIKIELNKEKRRSIKINKINYTSSMQK